ncbi:MAG: PilZ domain-containing protein [Treponema sp.]|jgi:hypothetical protein|nr:PilZ domain-containing protein [Treponema sp.]
MSEKRKNIRYNTLARARIREVFHEFASLKDIGITGCCIAYAQGVDIQLNTQYKIQIIPEPAAHIGKFELVAEARWIQTREYSCDYGFMIVASPQGKRLQRYVDYLTWRSILL